MMRRDDKTGTEFDDRTQTIDALLARLAPDWRLHLNDGRVIDRILERLP